MRIASVTIVTKNPGWQTTSLCSSGTQGRLLYIYWKVLEELLDENKRRKILVDQYSNDLNNQLDSHEYCKP